jgi:DNA primase
MDVDKEFGKCFACGETFNLGKLVAFQKGWYKDYKMADGKTETIYNYDDAYDWLEEKYNVERKEFSRENAELRRIDDEEEDEEERTGRYETPLVRIAPFRSGKATHDYFFDRGFTKETVRKFKVGWDMELMRVTTPIFWENEKLFGVIGRAILNPKLADNSDNPEYKKLYKGKNFARYFIYDNAPIGQILFPLNHFQLVNGEAVLVEGQYDAMWQHQNGFPNVLSSITSKLSVNKSTGDSLQVMLLQSLGVKKVILMRDDDKAGHDGVAHDAPLLKQYFSVYTTTYPRGKTDPQQLSKKEFADMIKNKTLYGLQGKKLRRMD